jgi:hypothetical protein
MRALILIPAIIFVTFNAFGSETIAPMSADASFEKIGIRCEGSQEIIRPSYLYRFGISVRKQVQSHKCEYYGDENDLCDFIFGDYDGSISGGNGGANENGRYVLRKRLSTGQYMLQYFFEAGGGQNLYWDPTWEFNNVNAQIWTADQVTLPQSHLSECAEGAGAYIYKRSSY